MREDALANDALDARKQNAGCDEARTSGRDGPNRSLGGVLIDGGVVSHRCVDGIGALFFPLNGYGSDSTQDRLSIATT